MGLGLTTDGGLVLVQHFLPKYSGKLAFFVCCGVSDLNSNYIIQNDGLEKVKLPSKMASSGGINVRFLGCIQGGPCHDHDFLEILAHL